MNFMWKDGRPVILDGATGMNLQKAGMPAGVCPEQWVIEHSDALKALQHSVSLTKLDEAQILAADVDGNEKVDASDALLMLQYSVKIIDRFPVEDQ